MKRVFLLGLLLGFSGVLAGAHLFPWVEHERVVSQTSVLANGGRQESFLVRLPADRVSAVGGGLMGIRAAAYPEGTALPPEFVGENILVEQFKLRDAGGTVVGLAARHATSTSAGATIAWSLVIPGRGALMLAARGPGPGAVDASLQEAGYTGASSWSGETRIAMVGDPELSRTVAGSNEFAGLDVRMTETWTVTGVDDGGAVRGTIELDTIGRRAE